MATRMLEILQSATMEVSHVPPDCDMPELLLLITWWNTTKVGLL